MSGSTPAKRRILELMGIFFLVLLSACADRRLLVGMEQPFWFSLGRDLPLKVEFGMTALGRGFVPSFLVIDAKDDPRERLMKAITGARFGIVVIGPLLSLEAEGIAPLLPRIRFILVGGPRAEDSMPNTVQLVFDRVDSFRLAGTAVGLSIQEQAGDSLQGSPGPRVGVLLMENDEGDIEETAAFKQGVADALNGAGPAVIELAQGVDRAKVRAAIQKMRREGVEIFLPRLGALDSTCLETLKEMGGSAVVSDWSASEAYAEQVFLSIEDDLRGGIALALDSVGRAQVVKGRVRIACGKARGIPAAAKGWVECK